MNSLLEIIRHRVCYVMRDISKWRWSRLQGIVGSVGWRMNGWDMVGSKRRRGMSQRYGLQNQGPMGWIIFPLSISNCPILWVLAQPFDGIIKQSLLLCFGLLCLWSCRCGFSSFGPWQWHAMTGMSTTKRNQDTNKK